MTPTRFTPRVEPLSDRIVPASPIWPSEIGQAVGADDGGSPVVHLRDRAGNTAGEFAAYDATFRGGVRTAVGDVTGDGVPDVVTAAGPGGGPHVKVFDGKTGAVVRGFFAYDQGFTGGVEVAVGDVNRDGYGDVITGAGAGGGPHVRVWSGKTGTELYGLFAYSQAFTGGVYVASGDLNRDGYDDVIVGAGAGGGPHVRAINGRTGAEMNSFYAFDATFRGGVRVASGDLNADGVDDLIVAAGPGGGPHVKAFDSPTGRLLLNRYVAEADFRGGVRPFTVPVTHSTAARDVMVASTRTGDVVKLAVIQSTGDTVGTPDQVWVGDGDPPPGSKTVTVAPQIASGVTPVRVIQGTVTSVAADGRSMTLTRGDGSTVVLDLAGDPPPPDGGIYIEGSISPAEYFVGDRPATVADVRPGRWVRVTAGRANGPAQARYMAMSVLVL